MRKMDGAIKRSIRLSRGKKQYLAALTDEAVFTTTDIIVAVDFTTIDDNQINTVLSELVSKGYQQAHMVTYGLQFVDEYGVERFYEKPFQRSHIPDLMALIEDDYIELLGEDE